MLPMGGMDGLIFAPGHSVADGGQSGLYEHPTYPQGLQMCDLPCTQDRPCVAKSHILREVTLLNTEHGGSKGVNLDKQSPILRCECRAHRMNGSGLVCLERCAPVYQATSWM
jgi:hypothetical protein